MRVLREFFGDMDAGEIIGLACEVGVLVCLVMAAWSAYAAGAP